MFLTNDISLACYLKIKGFKPIVSRQNKKGEFKFEENCKDQIASYYDNDGNYLLFNQTMRSLKSQIMNSVGDNNA